MLGIVEVCQLNRNVGHLRLQTGGILWKPSAVPKLRERYRGRCSLRGESAYAALMLADDLGRCAAGIAGLSGIRVVLFGANKERGGRGSVAPPERRPPG